MALVLVLGFLVIISALAVAFFASVTTELRASRNFQSSVNTRQLQETVVNLVEGQIRQATFGTLANGLPMQNVSWASQPGMISTFGDGTNASSAPLGNYKLYSSNVMTLLAGTTNPPLASSNPGTAPGTSNLPPAPTGDLVAGWDQLPAVWTDLNAPVLVQDPSPITNPSQSPTVTVPRFPVIDPRANATAGPPAFGSSGGLAVGQSGATSGPLVEGFSYTLPSGWNSSDVIVDTALGGNNDARLAMPVQWMYILKDGTLITPISGSGVQATFSASSNLTSTNPIVGRVAFWTDDDTSKLNINTAGGTWVSGASGATAPGGTLYSQDQYAGSFWDTPRVVSLFDEGQVFAPGVTSPTYTSGAGGNGGVPLPPSGTYGGGGGLAAVQMLQNEFQRYPGHPAQTSLAMVFRNILTPEQMYVVTPRLLPNGYITNANTTIGGTTRLHIPPTVPVTGAGTTNAVANVALPIRYDRLYDSVDEMLFAFNSQNGESGPRQTNTTLMKIQPETYTASTAPVVNPPVYSPGLLDQLRFFLTAYNRAPELNLFGHPRVCVWPVRSQTYQEDTTVGTPATPGGGNVQVSSGINAYDSLSLFCSTIGPTFANYNGLNSAATLTSTPPSVNNPPFHYSFFRREPNGPNLVGATQDINLPRNKQLMTYLQSFLTQKIPGFGQAFVPSKYLAPDMNETLVEMFDYIRCANLNDTTQTIPGPSNTPNYYNPHPFSPTGIVMPSVCTYLGSGTQNGMGRFPTICEATLIFYYAGSDKTVNGLYQVPTVNPALTALQEFKENSGVLVMVPPITPYATTTAPIRPSQFPTQRWMRAAIVFSTFNPMQGYGPINAPGVSSPLVTFQVDGLKNFSVTGGSVALVAGSPTTPFPNGTTTVTSGYQGPTGLNTIALGAVSGSFYGGRNFGGFEGFGHTLWNASTYDGNGNPLQGQYPLITPVGKQMELQIGTLNFPAGAGGIAPVAPAPLNNIADYEEATIPSFKLSYSGSTPVTVTVFFGGLQIQTIQIPFPAGPITLPAPRGDDIIDAEPFAVTGTSPNLTPNGPVGGYPVLASTLARTDVNLTTATGVAGGTQGGPQPYGQLRRWYWSQDLGSFDPNAGRKCPHNAGSAPTSWGNSVAPDNRTVGNARDFQQRINWVLGGSATAPLYTGNGSNSYNPDSPTPGNIINWYGGRWRQIVQPGDTVRSMIFCNLPSGTTTSPITTPTGDLRLAAVTNSMLSPTTATTSGFFPHPDFGTTSSGASAILMQQACILRMADGELYYNYAADAFFNAAVTAASGLGPANAGYQEAAQKLPYYSNQLPYGNHVALTSAKGENNAQFPAGFAMAHLPRLLGGTGAAQTGTPTATTPVCVNGVTRQDTGYGDFDTGVGSYADGPYFNKQDEGNATFVYIDAFTGQLYYPIPYFGSGTYASPGSAFNSPNRQMPSAIMMGSLLSRAGGIANGGNSYGWETLALCPNTAGVTPVHHGNLVAPKDYLLLDLFHMPVVQPYPISEPFSTAGKVNLNYQIQPFNYIQRSTALRAVLQSERVSIIGSATPTTLTPLTQGGSNPTGAPMFQQYKSQPTTSGQPGLPQEMATNIRKVIDRDQTMNEIAAYIAANGVFRSPAQICEIYLIPEGLWQPAVALSPTLPFATIAAAAQNNWTTGGDLTGDNLREKPYADIYPRLTTKSNTYTIHMRVQSLRQLPRVAGSTSVQIWDESKDAVLGEYRGSATIERYIDPSDPAFTGTGTTFVNPDLTSSTNTVNPTNSLEYLYRFRTVNTKKFSP